MKGILLFILLNIPSIALADKPYVLMVDSEIEVIVPTYEDCKELATTYTKEVVYCSPKAYVFYATNIFGIR